MGVRVFITSALVVFTLSGCGFPQAKLNEARGHVEKGLAAWKEGKKPDSLKPLVFFDELWARGYTLLSSEVQKTFYHEATKSVRCEVKLVVKSPGPRGKEEAVARTYDVELAETPRVHANDMP